VTTLHICTLQIELLLVYGSLDAVLAIKLPKLVLARLGTASVLKSCKVVEK
jgi:hypothetical protein